MTSFKSLFVAGVAATALMGAASAGGSSSGTPDTTLYNLGLSAQTNFNNIYSLLDIYGEWVGGDLRGQSVAIGNNISWSTEGAAQFDSVQIDLGNVGAETRATVLGGGSVDLSSVGICNNTSVDNAKSGGTSVRNDQRCNTTDPYAITTANLTGAFSGDVSATSTAIANNYNQTSVTGATFIYNQQVNAGAVYAQTNLNMGNVAGNATAAATAIGNSMVVSSGFKP